MQDIDEKLVTEWMIAQMARIKSEGLPVNSMSVTVSNSVHRDGGSYCYWGAHAAGECVTSEPSLEKAVAELKVCCYGDAAKKAADKRREAATLLAEADQLTAMTKTT